MVDLGGLLVFVAGGATSLLLKDLYDRFIGEPRRRRQQREDADTQRLEGQRHAALQELADALDAPLELVQRAASRFDFEPDTMLPDSWWPEMRAAITPAWDGWRRRWRYQIGDEPGLKRSFREFLYETRKLDMSMGPVADDGVALKREWPLPPDVPERIAGLDQMIEEMQDYCRRELAK